MSFGDLMSSAKGPGLIGLLLALVVLGGFIVLGTLTLDDQFQGGEKSLISIVRQQDQDIAHLRSELEIAQTGFTEAAGRKKIAAALIQRKAEIASLQAELGGRELLLAQTCAERDALVRTLGDYKARYRAIVRGAAKGKSFDQLECLDGNIYKQVSIREIDALGMTITHLDGTKRIPSKYLPLEMQDFYQFDAAETEKEKADEELAKKQYLLASAASQKANIEESRKNQREWEKSTNVRREQALSALTSSISALSDDIRKMERTIEDETQKRFSRAPQMREQLAAMQRQKAELETKLRILRSTP